MGQTDDEQPRTYGLWSLHRRVESCLKDIALWMKLGGCQYAYGPCYMYMSL